MVNKSELYDKNRSLTLELTSWYYHIDYPGRHLQETTNPFLISENGPFTNTRRDWIIEATKTIIDKLVATMIAEFGDRGIEGPPGTSTNAGKSIDWNYSRKSSRWDYTAGCAEADITLYKEIQKRLAGYKQQIQTLEARRDELLSIKERTDAEINELRDIRNKLERLFRIERGDIEQIDRLKERCPDIEEYK